MNPRRPSQRVSKKQVSWQMWIFHAIFRKKKLSQPPDLNPVEFTKSEFLGTSWHLVHFGTDEPFPLGRT